MPEVTTEELSTLEALAKAATPGPWKSERNPNFSRTEYTTQVFDASGKDVCTVARCPVKKEEWDWGKTISLRAENAAFIAAANPDTVLRLIAGIRELEGAR